MNNYELASRIDDFGERIRRLSVDSIAAPELKRVTEEMHAVALVLADQRRWEVAAVSPRVFILRLNFIILGVLTNEARAIHEAKVLIDAFTASGHSWVELQKDRMWRSSDGRWLEIDAHDVR